MMIEHEAITHAAAVASANELLVDDTDGSVAVGARSAEAKCILKPGPGTSHPEFRNDIHAKFVKRTFDQARFVIGH